MEKQNPAGITSKDNSYIYGKAAQTTEQNVEVRHL